MGLHWGVCLQQKTCNIEIGQDMTDVVVIAINH